MQFPEYIEFGLPVDLPLPPRLEPERQQDRADDHHAFHEDAKPGDLAGQLGTGFIQFVEGGTGDQAGPSPSVNLL